MPIHGGIETSHLVLAECGLELEESSFVEFPGELVQLLIAEEPAVHSDHSTLTGTLTTSSLQSLNERAVFRIPIVSKA